jgi:hypothetical protein
VIADAAVHRVLGLGELGAVVDAGERRGLGEVATAPSSAASATMSVR